MTLEDVIYERLAQTSGVIARVGHRIYRGWRPQGTLLPCITFVRVTTTPVNAAAGSTTTSNAMMQVDVWANTQSAARAIAEEVKTALDGWTHSSDPEVGPVLLDSDQDIVEDAEPGSGSREHRVSQEYSLWTAG